MMMADDDELDRLTREAIERSLEAKVAELQSPEGIDRFVEGARPRIIVEWLEAALGAYADDPEAAEFRTHATFVVEAWRHRTPLPTREEFAAHAKQATELGMALGLGETLREFDAASQDERHQLRFMAFKDRGGKLGA